MKNQPATVDRQIEASVVFGRRAFLPKQERPVELLSVDAAASQKKFRTLMRGGGGGKSEGHVSFAAVVNQTVALIMFVKERRSMARWFF